MKDIAIYGAGGLGREMVCLLEDINAVSPQWNVVGFYDDMVAKGTIVEGLPVCGGIHEINAISKQLNIVLAVSEPRLKERLFHAITSPQINFPVLIHPSCRSGQSNKNLFGQGTVLTAGVILTTHIKLGEFVLVNLASTVGHDVVIGNFSSVMPGCSISGNITLGDLCSIGTGARILQNLAIGSSSVIGAGAVVTKSFGSKSRLLGVPAVNVPLRPR